MPELVIEKHHNPVMDLSIAYGLFHILTDNDTKATLKNYPSAYVITYDHFDAEEAYLIPPDEEWVNFGRFLNRTHKRKMMENLYGTENKESLLLANNTLPSIIRYFETPIPDRTTDNIPDHARKNNWTGIIGTWYGGKGHRTAGNATTGYRAPLFERWLAELGFIHAVSFTSIKDNDFLLWVGIPSEVGTTDIRRFEDKNVNKETGEISRRQYLRSHSVEIALAQTQLGVQQKMQTSNIQNQYDGALYMRGWFNGNTGSPDWVNTLELYPFRENTVQAALIHMNATPRDKKIDFQHTLSTWLIERKQQSFYDAVAVIAKENRWVNPEESEDYLHMAGLTELHTNVGVVRIGRRLNELLFNKRGYTLTLDLMDVHTNEDLMRAVSNVSVEYDKLVKGRYPLWNKEEFDAFIETVDNPDYQGQDIASAILLLSKTRQEKKETI